MHHLSCGISSLLHSVNLILFTLLVHLILCASPHHSPRLPVPSLLRPVKNRRPYNLYCVGGDVKPCSINLSCPVWARERCRISPHYFLAECYMK